MKYIYIKFLIKKGVIIIKLDYFWAFPNCHTFKIKPIYELIEEYKLKLASSSIIIDPFANNSLLADISNDIDTSYHTDYHLDATDFLKIFKDNSVDMVLYDPPYSSRQVSECYKRLNLSVNKETTQSSYWRKHKEQISRIVKPKGYVISFGWNSNAIGKKYNFEKIHIRLISHGAAHNDTIMVVEIKK